MNYRYIQRRGRISQGANKPRNESAVNSVNESAGTGGESARRRTNQEENKPMGEKARGRISQEAKKPEGKRARGQGRTGKEAKKP